MKKFNAIMGITILFLLFLSCATSQKSGEINEEEILPDNFIADKINYCPKYGKTQLILYMVDRDYIVVDKKPEYQLVSSFSDWNNSSVAELLKYQMNSYDNYRSFYPQCLAAVCQPKINKANDRINIDYWCISKCYKR